MAQLHSPSIPCERTLTIPYSTSKYWHHIFSPSLTLEAVRSQQSTTPNTLQQTSRKHRCQPGLLEGWSFMWCHLANFCASVSCLIGFGVPWIVHSLLSLSLSSSFNLQFIIWLRSILYGEPCFSFVFMSAHMNAVGMCLILMSPSVTLSTTKNMLPWCVWCIFRLISFRSIRVGWRSCCLDKLLHEIPASLLLHKVQAL
jgi:hypothetical protein